MMMVIPSRAQRGEESAFSLSFSEMQMPRCARQDPSRQYFNKLLGKLWPVILTPENERTQKNVHRHNYFS
jgi:hypothetical protein